MDMTLGLDMKERLCRVNGEPAYFLTWSYNYGGTLAIVEFADGIKVIDPTLIKFEDEDHDMLCDIVKMDSKRRGNKNA